MPAGTALDLRNTETGTQFTDSVHVEVCWSDPPQPDTQRRCTFAWVWVVWLVFAAAISFKTLADPVTHSVYPCFENGSLAWWAGTDVFDPQQGATGFRYGPAFAVAFLPLALLPTTLGALVWVWLNLGIFYRSMQSLIRHGLPGEPSDRQEAIYLTLLLLAAGRSLWSSQTNMLVISLAALAVVAMRRERWWTAAWLLAMPVHIKAWPLVGVVLLVACRPRQLAGRVAVALVGVGLLPFLTKSMDYVLRQYAGWWTVLRGPAQLRHDYRDAWTFWDSIHRPVDPQAYLVLQVAAGLSVLAVCLWYAMSARHSWLSAIRWGRPGSSMAGQQIAPERLFLVALVMWTAWQLVLGFGTERNTFGLIAPLSTWALLTSFRDRYYCAWMTLTYIVMVGGSFGVLERALLPYSPVVAAAHPLGVVGFFVWFLGWNSHQSSCLAANS